jgi:hypothetical protein
VNHRKVTALAVSVLALGLIALIFLIAKNNSLARFRSCLEASLA